MGKAAMTWTDARLDDLADALAPLPADIAVLKATVNHWDHMAAALEPVPAVLAAAVERLADENRALRTELAATQHQLLQIAWGLVRRCSAPQPHSSPRWSDAKTSRACRSNGACERHPSPPRCGLVGIDPTARPAVCRSLRTSNRRTHSSREAGGLACAPASPTAGPGRRQ